MRTRRADQTDRTPKQVEALYRKRSAIETIFRTFREARAKTTTRDPAVRLLFVLFGFLLRNLWLVVRWSVLAQPRHGGRELPIWFRFEVFREWIAHDLDEVSNASGKPRRTVSAFLLLTGCWTRADQPASSEWSVLERSLRFGDGISRIARTLTVVSAP